jgi:hypothetical protein
MLNTENFDLEYLGSMIGAATFDLSGLPREYFVRVGGSQTIAWVQNIFQILGVRSLLAASFKLEGFSHSVARGAKNAALIVKQPNGYLAILYQPDYINLTRPNLTAWAKQFNASQLKRDKNFQVV